MINKKIVLLLLLICVLSVSSVNAMDDSANGTFCDSNEETVCIDDNQVIDNNCDSNEETVCIDDNQVIDNNIKTSNNNKEDILSSVENNDVISFDNSNDVLSSSPPSTAYSVSVFNHIIRSGAGGAISVTVNSCTGYTYAYDFHLKIYDSKNSLKIDKRYYDSVSTSKITCSISSNELPVGEYTIKLINTADGKQMDSAKLSIAQSDSASSALTYDQYSVRVSSSSMNYGSSGSISMSITPSSSRYKYDFYLKIYDSNNKEKISQRYSSTESATSKTYTVAANQLSVGTYTIKIINTYDSKQMSSATLTVKSSSNPSNPSTGFTYPLSSFYSVSVSSFSMTYGSSGSISMNISPSSSSTYKYYYTLKVYDSNNNEKISQVYSGTSADYSKSYTIDSSLLNSGSYTIKIINYVDNDVMDTATLVVKSPEIPFYPTYLDYSVDVPETSVAYGSYGVIKMNITPASTICKYYYYLKVYDSDNNEIIDTMYLDTPSSETFSKTYTINSNKLNLGNYTIKIINAYDNKVMNTAKLAVKYYPYYSDYSVSISDTTIDAGAFEWIVMNRSPSSGSTMKYSYYVKIYDSRNNEVTSKLYNGTSTYTRSAHDIRSNELIPGTYTVKIINYADNAVMDTAKLTVTKTSTNLIASDVTTEYNDNNYLIVTLKDKNGNPIKGENLSIDLNGIKSFCTDSNGQVKVSTAGLIPKTYAATITFGGNDWFDKSTATAKIVVNKIKTLLSSADVAVIYNVNNNLVATLKDSNNNPIEGVNVSININCLKTLITDANGKVKVSTIGLIPKTYTTTITFDGNMIYEKSTFTTKVIIKKATPKITAKAKTFKKSVKTKKYSITLKNNLNKVMKNTKVTIKVNKKTYTAKTNSKGVATFKITKLTKKGTFKSVITYKGDKYYNKVTKTINIKVK